MALKGKTAVVTGSTSGIGLGMALALAKAGANVMINGLGSEVDDRGGDQGSRGGRHARALRSRQHAAAQSDRSDGRQRCEKELGSVDILVNNAGIQHVAPVEEFPIEKWDAIIAINLTSAFHTTRAAVPGMKQRKWGRIINIVLGALAEAPRRSSRPTCRPSTASPASPRRSRWSLPSHGITANAISPGFVWTPLVEKQIPDLAKSRRASRSRGEEGGAAKPADRPLRRSRADRSARGLPGERGGRLDHRRQLLDRRRLDRAVGAPLTIVRITWPCRRICTGHRRRESRRCSRYRAPAR